MKLFFKLVFLIFISLNLFPEELELQSKDKKPGDVLSSSEWNSVMKKLNSSTKKVKEEMLIGNWSCTGLAFSGASYGGSSGWVADNTPAPFTVHQRSGYLLTFAAGNPGTWDASANSPNGRFFNNADHPLTGKFKVLNNELFISWSDSIQRSFALRFHGPKRFAGKKTGHFSGPLRNFYCDKQS